jgi:hypothetical protein
MCRVAFVPVTLGVQLFVKSQGPIYLNSRMNAPYGRPGTAGRGRGGNAAGGFDRPKYVAGPGGNRALSAPVPAPAVAVAAPADSTGDGEWTEVSHSRTHPARVVISMLVLLWPVAGVDDIVMHFRVSNCDSFVRTRLCV